MKLSGRAGRDQYAKRFLVGNSQIVQYVNSQDGGGESIIISRYIGRGRESKKKALTDIVCHKGFANVMKAGWTHKLNHHLCSNQINSRDHWHTMATANQTIIVII